LGYRHIVLILRGKRIFEVITERGLFKKGDVTLGEGGKQEGFWGVTEVGKGGPSRLPGKVKRENKSLVQS